MYHTIKRQIVLLGAMAMTFCAHAQMVEITARDTTGLSQASIACNGDFRPLRFTQGRMTYDKADVKPFTTAFIMSNNISVPLVLEPGQTLRVTLSHKKDSWSATYQGKNADVCRFQKQLQSLNAAGWEIITLDEYGDEETSLNKNYDFDGRMQQLAKAYPATLAMADKIANDSLRRACRHVADVTYLTARIACLSARDEAKGIKEDAQLQQLIATIDPNDGEMTNQGLVDKWLATKVKGSPDDDNFTDYALSYIKTVDKNITNPRTRHQLFDAIASSVFTADNKTFVLDDFWKAFTQAADTSLVNYYQTVVDSKRATKSGAPCPDEAFMDANGQTHQLSEWFNKGKYLFIDIWATWCIPCCKEIPYIEQHVEHYKNNPKIQFVSISLDNHHDAWQKKLDKDKPAWPQYISATKDEMDKLMKDWGITGIPRFIIVNPDGTIHDSNAMRLSDPLFREKMDAMLK